VIVVGERRIRPDIAFPTMRIAVFVDGCFWHMCPAHGTRPRTHGDYWGPKLTRNVARDREVDSVLADAGWHVVRLWEHEAGAHGVAIVRDALGACPRALTS
jgi:DNA mismatch endonuclease (patch repair protein)